MVALIKARDALVKTWQDVHQMTKVSQLLEYIPDRTLATLSFGLLAIWVLSPAMMLLNLMLKEQLKWYLLDYISWIAILQMTGNFGLIVAMGAVGKTLLRLRRDRVGVRQFLSTQVLPLCLLLMLIWSAFSTILSDNRMLSFMGTGYRQEGLLTYLAYTGIFGCSLLFRDRRRVQLLLEFFSVGAALVCVYYLVTWQPELTKKINPGIFMNSNHTAYYFCLAIFTSLSLYICETRSRWWTWIWLAAFSISIAALIVNKSFGPYLAAIGGIILGVVFYSRPTFPTQRYRLGISTVVFIVLSISINFALKNISQDFNRLFEDLVNITKDNQGAAHAGSSRWTLWTIGVRLISERPLFGYGLDNLGTQFIANGVTYNDRPHNEFIYYAASMGIPAMLFYVVGLIAHLRDFLRARKSVTSLTVGLYCTVGAYLISSVFGNSMYYTTPFFFMFLGLSFSQLQADKLESA